MSSRADLLDAVGRRRNGSGPDACPVAADGTDAVDDRGWERVVSADFDMGAWFDTRTTSTDTETRCF